jgi:hypothetical protein
MSEQKDLTNWIKEIQDGMYGVLVSLQAAAHFVSIRNDITHRRISGLQLAVQKLSRPRPFRDELLRRLVYCNYGEHRVSHGPYVECSYTRSSR